MPVIRVAVTPRYAVTHEMTSDGLMITPDQVITADPAGEPPPVPLGEIVTPDTLAWDVPPALQAEWEAQQGITPAPAAPAPPPMMRSYTPPPSSPTPAEEV